jgi:hypothetical protein
MRIFGYDFTSAPTRHKPITCAVCLLDNSVLHLEEIRTLTTFGEFEIALQIPGTWVAGLDFPFGQPRKLVKNLAWLETWEGYVRHVGAMTISEFERMLAQYRAPRLKGDKQHLRNADLKAESRSPMMLYGVPVGRMFFQGAPRLLNSGVSILPCRPRDDSRIAVEAYPALVARRWIDRSGYKSDSRRKQTSAHHTARQMIVDGIRSPHLHEYYGFDVALDDFYAHQFVNDPSGDQLDALLCAIQAAWSFQQQYGIPTDCDALEGWIVDPVML